MASKELVDAIERVMHHLGHLLHDQSYLIRNTRNQIEKEQMVKYTYTKLIHRHSECKDEFQMVIDALRQRERNFGPESVGKTEGTETNETE